MASRSVRIRPPQRQLEAPKDPDAPLFRSEVLAERQTQFLGKVLLEPRLSASVFSAIAVLAVTAILTFLVFGSFTRKAQINGWLVPESGLVRLYAPGAGQGHPHPHKRRRSGHDGFAADLAVGGGRESGARSDPRRHCANAFGASR